MRIFFAGPGVPKNLLEILLSFGVKNFLISYENPSLVEAGAQALELAYPGNSFLLDSGAFSAWNSGRTIDLAAYIDFAKDFIARHKHRISNIYVVNLDVIPGKQGEIPTRKQTEEAAQQGWENMLAFERAGIAPVHIFHQGEDFKWLERIATRHRYIGISPSNDASTKAKFEWMRVVYSMIKAKNMTHGFAVTSKKLMESFPWFSVDSISWKAPLIWGRPVFSRTFEEMGLSSRVKSHVSYTLNENVKNLLQLEKRYTALWAARGVVWE